MRFALDIKNKCLSVFVVLLTAGLLLGFFASPAMAQSSYAFSGSWQYTLRHQVVVDNPGGSAVKDVEVTVPLMDLEMPLYQQRLSEQFDPWPDKIITDDNGNRYAVYHIAQMAPKSKLTLTQTYLINAAAIKYDLIAKEFSLNDYRGFDATYLSPSEGVQSSHPEIVTYAKEVAGTEDNPYQLARKVFTDVNLFMTYDDGEAYANKGALSARRSGRGVCEDYTGLFVAVMRSLGVPTRVQTGYLFMPKEHMQAPYLSDGGQSLDLSLLSHSWPEFYLQGIGWVIVDPTFTYSFDFNGRTEKIVDWDYFANITSDRRYLVFRENSLGGGHISHNHSDVLSVSFDATLSWGNALVPFNDIKGHWAEEEIIKLYNAGLVEGVGNGVFGVEQNLTRAQMAVFLQRYFNAVPAKPSYGDVAANYWAAAEIGAAQAQGWLTGFADGSFKPQQNISRAETVTALVRAFGLTKGEKEVSFNDLGQSGWQWADASILIAASCGLTAGRENGNFAPQANITRAEFITFLARAISIRENKE